MCERKYYIINRFLNNTDRYYFIDRFILKFSDLFKNESIQHAIKNMLITLFVGRGHTGCICCDYSYYANQVNKPNIKDKHYCVYWNKYIWDHLTETHKQQHCCKRKHDDW